MVSFCSKWIVNLFFCIFKNSYYNLVAKNTQGLKGKAPEKKFVLSIDSWISTFFSFSFNIFFYSWFYMM
jgi:hypothetical protein